MSTEHQQYSTANQRGAIAAYALAHGLEIVRTYADEGRSGLTLKDRPALVELLGDVASGDADYSTVLVFDVSRWGRFQDSDEAAFYEYFCRRAGIAVVYCAEPFANDGAPISAVLKSLKRVMAAEYSRELSAKVAEGKRRSARAGFHIGGPAVLGFRRLVVDSKGSPRGLLEEGQQKYLQSDRVVLVPGPEEEVRTVRWIFEQAADRGRRPADIARELQRRSGNARRWSGQRVGALLRNEKYIGNVVLNRCTCRLKGPTVRNPPEQWVRADGVIEGIIDPDLFGRAQQAVASWSNRLSDEAALDALREILARHGKITLDLINATPGALCAETYQRRFGGLLGAYARIGYDPARDNAFLAGRAARGVLLDGVRRRVLDWLGANGHTAELRHRAIITVDGRLDLAVVCARARDRNGTLQWRVFLNGNRTTDWVLAARLDPTERQVLAYCLVAGTSCEINLNPLDGQPGPQTREAAEPEPLLEWLLVTRCLDRPGQERALDPAAAAEYIRVSTNHQEASLAVQREVIAEYARGRGLRIVRSYVDEGRSGRSLRGRDGLRALLQDVSGGRATFGTLLVFDVSRWGRFPDCDESAYYEYICRRAGLSVAYCTEPFENDGSAMPSIIKALKRMMAAEYSRELSEKVLAGKLTLAGHGFRMGGSAGFGLRRLLIDAKGRPLRVLELGESKGERNDRVVLVPGPPEELRRVRWIFQQVARGNRRPLEIARDLNRRGVILPDGRPWNAYRVTSILTNEKYVGTLVFNRNWRSDDGGARAVRIEGAYPAVVSPRLFARVQRIVGLWATRVSDEDALDALRRLLKKHGRLTNEIIDSAPGLPGAAFFRRRFNGLHEAYRLVGYEPPRDLEFARTFAARRDILARFRQQVTRRLEGMGVRALWGRGPALTLNGRVRVGISLGYRCTGREPAVWHAQCAAVPQPRWKLIGRMNREMTEIVGYSLADGGSGNVLIGVPNQHRKVTSGRSLAPFLARLAAAANRLPRRSESAGRVSRGTR